MIKEYLPWIGGAAAFLLSLIEIPKIKLNVWAWLAKVIGNAFSHDVITKLDEHNKTLTSIAKDVENLKTDVDNVKKDSKEADERNKADQCRQRVLRFNDELLHHVKHSKEYFDDMLIDIDDYEEYCNAHPGYKNSRAELAIENIKETYKKLSKEGGFL